MSYFRLLLCSFLIPTLSLCAMQRTKNTTSAPSARTISFDHIKPLLSADIIHNVDLLKKNQGSNAMLFVGATEADFKLVLECIAQEIDYDILRCSAQNIAAVVAAFAKARETEYTLVIIDDLANINSEQAKVLYRQLMPQKNMRNNSCVIGWVPSDTQLQEDIHTYFNIPLELSLPNEAQRKEFLKGTIQLYMPQKHGINSYALAQKSIGWSTTNLLTLVQNSFDNIRRNNTFKGKTLTHCEHFELTYQIISQAKAAAHNATLAASSISYVKPNITFTDLAGTLPKDMYDVKRTIERDGYHHSILLHGPPGTGKTSIAEAVANDIGWKLVRLDGSAFASSYQDGPVIRFKNAMRALQDNGEPTVVCIDECGALFNAANHNANASQEALLNNLRTVIEDCNNNRMRTPILFIATTNDFEKIDAALKSRLSGYTYNIEAPTDTAREEVIIALMTKVTNDKTLKDTRATLIKDLVKYSKELSIRDINTMMHKAKALALNNGSATIGDRYFFQALSAILATKLNAEEENKRKEESLKTMALAQDVAREVTIRVVAQKILDKAPETTLKTIAAGTGGGLVVLGGLAALEVGGTTLKTNPGMRDQLRKMFLFRNTLENVGDLEVAAVMKETDETTKKAVLNQSQNAKNKEIELNKAKARALEQKQLLQKTSIRLYQILSKSTDREITLKFIKELRAKIAQRNSKQDKEAPTIH